MSRGSTRNRNGRPARHGCATSARTPVRHLQWHRCVIVVGLVAALTAGACSGGGDEGVSGPSSTGTGSSTDTTPVEPQVFDAGDPGFYEAPAQIPAGRHGDLIRTQPLENAPDGVTWQRIMYLSETLAGEPTVVTGVVTLPDAAPPADGWPLFGHAHGSTGLADACAPSVSLTADRTYSIEISLLSAWVLQRGIAVVSTDYEGLGGPGRHPFLVGESEARSVLDGILAARQLPGVTFADAVGIIGYSQGGHAAAWANQIAPHYTPDLAIIGTLAGAPATEVDAMVAGDETIATLMVAALSATGPPYDPDSILTDAGRNALEQIDTVCQDAYTFTGDLLRHDVSTTEPWASGVAAQVPGDEPGAGPVLIVHSQADASVPVEASEAFQRRLCAAGQVVERRVLPDGDHVTAAIAAYEQGLDWITELATGGEPRSTCP